MAGVEALRTAAPRPEADVIVPAPRVRADIQGLRAVAVVAVVAFHAAVPGFSGGFVGVDVFFVISGFLVTGMLVGEHARTGRVRLGAFYARRIRRLLPMSALVLLATLLAVRLVVPPLLWPQVSHVARWTAVYAVNRRLALDRTNYLADDAPSPLQHYWSLAVEEQFYLVWPALLVVVLLLARRRRAPAAALVPVVAAVTAVSFAACVVRVASNQPAAFFGLPTRGWELGVGALCAVVARRATGPPGRAPAVLGGAGLAAILGSVVLLGPATTHPGWATLVPVLGTAAVLLAGREDPTWVPAALRAPPVQWVGRVSYSLYLWHWPLLVVPVLATDEALTAAQRAGLMVVALVLAGLGERFVERPFRRVVPSGRGGSTVAAVAAAATVTVLLVVVAVASASLPRLSTHDVVAPAAAGRVVTAAATDEVPANLTPSLTGAERDLPEVYGSPCHDELLATELAPCRFGRVGAPRRVMLLGDSHAAQWFPAFRDAATAGGWELTSLSKSSCPLVDAPVTVRALGRPFVECDTWRRRVVERARVERPDVIVLSAYSTGYRSLLLGSSDVVRDWSAALARTVRSLPAGSRVVVLGDNPVWSRAPVVCLSGHLEDAGRCSRPPSAVTDEALSAASAAAARSAGAQSVSTLPWVCDATCPTIRANVLMYRDTHHVTATYARLLAPVVARDVLGARD